MVRFSCRLDRIGCRGSDEAKATLTRMPEAEPASSGRLRKTLKWGSGTVPMDRWKQSGAPSLAFREGFRETIPLVISVFAYGLAYGVLARQAGLTYWETVFMSGAVFAGAAQMVGVRMIAEGASSGQIIMTTLVLNLRHLLMGASLAPYLAGAKPSGLAVMAHGLNDESYAATIARFQRKGGSGPYFLGSGAAIFVGWVSSSLVAGAAAGWQGLGRYGLDYAALGAFIGLLVPQLTDEAMWVSFAVAAAASLVLSRVLPGRWYIVFAALGASAAGVVFETRTSTGRGPHRSGKNEEVHHA